MERDQILKTLVSQHPRILINDTILDQVRSRIGLKPDVACWYGHLKSEAESLLDAPTSHYEIPDGRRLLAVSRRVKERIRLLGLVYYVEDDRVFANRAIDEAMAACSFPDWNPAHFLDTAEMTYAQGMAYDWFYPLLDKEQREILVTSIVEMGLKPGLEVYAQPSGWHKNVNNWNQVCNGGLGLGALAIADVEPEIAAEILDNAITHLPAASTHYAPDGAGTEGVTYWDYGARYNCLFLEGLQTALGTDFGLGDLDGFKESGDYQIYFAGADRLSFNFGDCGLRRMSTPMHFWMAKRFGIPTTVGFAGANYRTSHGMEMCSTSFGMMTRVHLSTSTTWRWTGTSAKPNPHLCDRVGTTTRSSSPSSPGRTATSASTVIWTWAPSYSTQTASARSTTQVRKASPTNGTNTGMNDGPITDFVPRDTIHSSSTPTRAPIRSLTLSLQSSDSEQPGTT
jgi:hypothetical protein